MSIKKRHAFYKKETVRNFENDLCYVLDVKAAPQHGIDVYYGRLVTNERGRGVILTSELVEFVKETLDWKEEAFNLPFCFQSLRKFRHMIQLNPYNSYKQWLANPKRPTFVTFDQSILRPEVVENIDGQRFTLFSAEMTELSIPLLRGYVEHKQSLSKNPELILTPELIKVITDYQMEPEVLLTLIPLKKHLLDTIRKGLKQKTIRDIEGNVYYIKKVKAVPQHDIHIHYGRLVTNTSGCCRTIMTSELMEFIKDTLNWKKEAFNLPFSYSFLCRLRCTVQYSPFDSYKKWREAPESPSYVVFDHRSHPEIIEDVDGQKFILYSAEMSGLSIPVLSGYKEEKYKYNLVHTSPEIILTAELSTVFSDYRMEPKVLLALMPFKQSALEQIRHRLNYENISIINISIANAFFAEKLDDLIALGSIKFHKKFPDFTSLKVIYSVSNNIRAMLAMHKKGGNKNDKLFTLLKNDWLKNTKITKKELYQHFELIGKNSKFKRAYTILKLAKRI